MLFLVLPYFPYVIPTALYVIPAKAGIQKNNSHPEFISGSTTRDAQNLFSMTRVKKTGFLPSQA
ncbi:hypothetical protein [Rickettsia endosymbiont of Orchestes rusci]|uniref:hypothetical protein n=1 Tax=Rickettsia endosymbiont of Orchestes rusci TaxID=3066250 RepID=UPI00313BC61A